jgi:hypothetical protein
MAAISVGTRTMPAVCAIPKLVNIMSANVMVGKGAHRDDPRVPIRSAEAGVRSPGGDNLIDTVEKASIAAE